MAAGWWHACETSSREGVIRRLNRTINGAVRVKVSGAGGRRRDAKGKRAGN